MGRGYRAGASVGLAWVASIAATACASGSFSVGDNREPLGSPEAGVPDAVDGMSSAPGTFRDLCLFARAIVVEDTATVDNDVSLQMVAAIQAACGTTVTTRRVSQSDPGILASDGRPLWSASELGVLTGGPQIHDAVRYLDANAAEVHQELSGTNFVWSERATGNVIVSVPEGAFSTSHDVGIMQVVREPIGGTLSLNVYGHELEGTLAASFYFRNVVAPNLRTDGRRYYVVEWTDQDGDETPSVGDRFDLRGSG